MKTLLRLMVILLTVGFAFAGCDTGQEEPTEGSEDVGGAIGDALEDAAEGAEDAAEEVEETVEDATDE